MFILPRLCTEEAGEDSLAISAVRKEKKLLNGMVQNLLLEVGSSVRTLSLAYSAAVSSKMVRNACQALLHSSDWSLLPHVFFLFVAHFLPLG